MFQLILNTRCLIFGRKFTHPYSETKRKGEGILPNAHLQVEVRLADCKFLHDILMVIKGKYIHAYKSEGYENAL